MIRTTRRTIRVLIGTGLAGIGVVFARAKFNDFEDAYWEQHEPWRNSRTGAPPLGTPTNFGWQITNGVRTLGPTQSHDKPRIVVLGTGWAAISLISNIDLNKYEVRVVSPRNFFLFSPLLPAATAGGVNPDSICTPIRDLISYKNESVWRRIKFMLAKQLPPEVRYYHAECHDIDFQNKMVMCREVKPVYVHAPEDSATAQTTPNVNVATGHQEELREFQMAYDYCVIGVGSKVNTFGTTGVEDNCLFMKEINDALAVRNRVYEHFEKAALPTTTDEERHRLLQFVVVGGGPTGVEVAAELQDLFREDLLNEKNVMYKNAIKAGASVTLVQSADRLLDTYETKISQITMDTIAKAGTKVLLNHKVTAVTKDTLKMTNKITGESVEQKQGLTIWTTGVGPRRLIRRLSAKLAGQTNKRALITDGWLRVQGQDKHPLPGVFALGDCSTIEQSSLLHEISGIFSTQEAISLEDLKNLVDRHRNYLIERYPHSRRFVDSLEANFTKFDKDGNGVLDKNEMLEMLQAADSAKRSLPATAQAAKQQGIYLAKMLNAHPEPSLVLAACAGQGPFSFLNKGQMAYVGNNVAVMSLGDENRIIMGDDNITNVMWHAAYWWMLMGLRTKAAVSIDWLKLSLFGRNTARW